MPGQKEREVKVLREFQDIGQCTPVVILYQHTLGGASKPEMDCSMIEEPETQGKKLKGDDQRSCQQNVLQHQKYNLIS